MNIDYNNITPGDLWFARFCFFVGGLVLGLWLGG
jgi:hypothetical protein